MTSWSGSGSDGGPGRGRDRGRDRGRGAPTSAVDLPRRLRTGPANFVF